MDGTGAGMREERRAYRAWLRAHHPDAGGDAAAFARGLERWRQGAAGRAEVRAHRAPRTPLGRLADAVRRGRARRERARRLR